MAKRFTDTDKWRDPWFKRLKGKAQLFWLFVLDTCDHAGVWQEQLDEFHFFSGMTMTHDEIAKAFSGRLIEFKPSTYIVMNFIKFQYTELNPANNAHKGVLKALEVRGLTWPLQDLTSCSQAPSEGLSSPTRGAQDKEQDKDLDMEQDQAMRPAASQKNEPAQVIDLLNITCSRQFKTNSKTNLKLASARLKDGFTMDDFVTVFKHKASEWAHDPKMHTFLRPETLLGNKFEGYLQAARSAPSAEETPGDIIRSLLPDELKDTGIPL